MTVHDEFDMGNYWLSLDDDPAADEPDDAELDDAEIESEWARDEAGGW